LPDAALETARARLREQIDVDLYTPGNPNGRPLSISIAPEGLGRLGQRECDQVARYSAAGLAGMMNYSEKGPDQARFAILCKAIEQFSLLEPDAALSLSAVIKFIREKDPSLVSAVGHLDAKLFERLVEDLETLRMNRGEFLSSRGEPLHPEALLGLGRHAVPGKTRLSIISTKFIGANQDIQFWMSQFLVALFRWASRSPAAHLQAAVLFDEADLYLPAQRNPSAKEPMENLLKRARTAGLGLLLASQNPGDFDYKCRDNIRTWCVGRIEDSAAIANMKSMLSECEGDVASRLPTHETGEFSLLRDRTARVLHGERSIVAPERIAEDEIVSLAAATVPNRGDRDDSTPTRVRLSD
jgi:hypothetical protein